MVDRFNEFTLQNRYWGDIRTVAMMSKFGAQSAAVHLRILSELNARESHSMPTGEFILLAESMSIGTPRALLEFLASADVGYLTINPETNEISSNGVNKVVAKRSEGRKLWREAKRKPKTSEPLLIGTISEKPVSDAFPTGKPSPTPTPSDLINKETVTRFLILDPIALDGLRCSQGAEVVERAIELAEADIEKKRLTPDYARLVREAKSGIAFLKAWPLSRAREQLAGEGAATARLNRAKAPPKDFDAERKQKQKEERERWAKEGT